MEPWGEVGEGASMEVLINPSGKRRPPPPPILHSIPITTPPYLASGTLYREGESSILRLLLWLLSIIPFNNLYLFTFVKWRNKNKYAVYRQLVWTNRRSSWFCNKPIRCRAILFWRLLSQSRLCEYVVRDFISWHEFLTQKSHNQISSTVFNLSSLYRGLIYYLRNQEDIVWKSRLELSTITK